MLKKVLQKRQEYDRIKVSYLKGVLHEKIGMDRSCR